MWPKRLAPGAALVFECEEGGGQMGFHVGESVKATR